MKLTNYLRNGKGHGLLLAFCISIVLALCTALTSFCLVQYYTASPEAQAFINEFPTLTFKDGTLQEDVIWARPLHLPNNETLTVVVDSSRDNVSLPLNPGTYITRSKLIAYDGETAQQWAFKKEPASFVLKDQVKSLKTQLPVALGLAAIVIFWIGLSLTILLTALLAWLAKIHATIDRTSRVSLIVFSTFTFIGWFIAVLAAFLKAFLVFGFYPWVVLSAIVSTITLYFLQEKEI